MKYGAHINVEVSHKGHAEQLNHDEIHTFADARYVRAPETLNFNHPLSCCDNTYFYHGDKVDTDTNANHANHLLYTEIPTHYNIIFESQSKKWMKCQRGSNKVISHMHAPSLFSEQESYYLSLCS